MLRSRRTFGLHGSSVCFELWVVMAMLVTQLHGCGRCISTNVSPRDRTQSMTLVADGGTIFDGGSKLYTLFLDRQPATAILIPRMEVLPLGIIVAPVNGEEDPFEVIATEGKLCSPGTPQWALIRRAIKEQPAEHRCTLTPDELRILVLNSGSITNVANDSATGIRHAYWRLRVTEYFADQAPDAVLLRDALHERDAIQSHINVLEGLNATRGDKGIDNQLKLLRADLAIKQQELTLGINALHEQLTGGKRE